ncbi:MAG: hypothetical protein R2795_02750 [Saprospiraceae bacterium]
MAWEREFDCNRQFHLWILATDLADEAELLDIEQQAKADAMAARTKAWNNFRQPINSVFQSCQQILQALPASDARDTHYRS